MPRTSKAKEKYWSRHVADLEASGLSRKAYCRKKKINVHTLDYWKRKLDDLPKPAPKKKPSFKAVAITGLSKQSSNAYEIELANDRVIKLPSDFDPAKVKSLIEILEPQAC